MLGKSIALVKKTEAPAIVSAASPPKIVTEGILDLLAVPAGQAQSPDDRRRLLRLYAESVDGFPLGMVERVLKKLRFNNPRNPFPATPQDVRERCVSALKTWKRRIEAFYFGPELLPEVSHFAPGGRARSIEERNLLMRKQRQELQGKWGADEGDIIMSMIDGCEIENFGPEPFKPGCVLPDSIVVAVLRAGIPSRWSAIIEMSQENFDRIPVEAFPDGQKQNAVAQRKHATYLAEMDPELRRHRAWVLKLFQARNETAPSEDDVMREARERLEVENLEGERRLRKHGRQIEAPV
jgi:hypothetical protein